MSRKTPDLFDQLKLLGLNEDCGILESVLDEQRQKYHEDPEIKKLLDGIYHGPDPHKNFSDFLNSREWKAFLRLLYLFGVKHSMNIVEVGGGSGFLIYSLRKNNFKKLTLIEPNRAYINGTGFLRTLPESKEIEIYEDIDRWHLSGKKYDVVITKGCLHHFRNIAYVAATIRQRLENGGLWFVEREWFADDAKELAEGLKTHPYCQSDNIYEWAYPAYHYVDALESVGMKLHAVAPLSYDDIALHGLAEGKEPTEESISKTIEFDKTLANNPEVTVERFWSEVKANKFEGQSLMEYTRPSLMVFQKVLIS